MNNENINSYERDQQLLDSLLAWDDKLYEISEEAVHPRTDEAERQDDDVENDDEDEEEGKNNSSNSSRNNNNDYNIERIEETKIRITSSNVSIEISQQMMKIWEDSLHKEEEETSTEIK